MNKQTLSERDICTKFITPALEKAGWDVLTQVREEFLLTKGRIIVRGKLHTRGQHKRADYVLFHKPNLPIAVIEAKDNKHAIGSGNPTIGLLLCKSKNTVVAEYALRDKTQPIGVAEYQLIESLPEELQTSLPSIEQIERELGGEHE
ncbi:PDDEXK nuclease domain-containing protein [Burkholderia cenocepacia]|uniref:PDDEXK nuclease domain-containing protein n=1 Tax=Burkholderia cenocepacia TaxID=95486 RepID=UPI000CFF6910|nr:hypothetical protein C6T64_20910 [Burkholderia cenocepacia]